MVKEGNLTYAQAVKSPLQPKSQSNEQESHFMAKSTNTANQNSNKYEGLLLGIKFSLSHPGLTIGNQDLLG